MMEGETVDEVANFTTDSPINPDKVIVPLTRKIFSEFGQMLPLLFVIVHAHPSGAVSDNESEATDNRPSLEEVIF